MKTKPTQTKWDCLCKDNSTHIIDVTHCPKCEIFCDDLRLTLAFESIDQNDTPIKKQSL